MLGHSRGRWRWTGCSRAVVRPTTHHVVTTLLDFCISCLSFLLYSVEEYIMVRTIIANFRAKPENVDKLKAKFQEAADVYVKDKGTLSWTVLQDPKVGSESESFSSSSSELQFRIERALKRPSSEVEFAWASYRTTWSELEIVLKRPKCS